MTTTVSPLARLSVPFLQRSFVIGNHRTTVSRKSGGQTRCLERRSLCGAETSS
jgi:hypothetical protein